MERKANIPLSSLSIIGEKSYSQDILRRTRCLKNEIYLSEINELIKLLKEQLQELNINPNSNEIPYNKNNDVKRDKDDININYKSFLLHQFLCGTFIDILVYIQNEINFGKISQSLNELISLSLDIIIFILNQIKSNILIMKFFINNIKSLLFENIFAIFASFRIILSNIEFMFTEDFISTELISQQKEKIINECYNIILNDSEINNIPIEISNVLISFISLNKKRNINIQISKVYEIYLQSLEKLYGTEKINDKENEIDYYTRLNSLDLLLNFILNYSDIKTSLEYNNINKAIDIFSNNKYLKYEDIYKYIDKLFDNIKNDNEHKSIIQSIILIQKLLMNMDNPDNTYEQNLYEKLDNKYSIFNLFINDLTRYINVIKEKNLIPEPDSIYEGIFTHEINIRQRLEFIFFLEKGIKNYGGLKLDSKENLEKIYFILINN